MVDLVCAGDAFTRESSKKARSLYGDNPSDPKTCGSTNPCLLALMDQLPQGMLVLPPTDTARNDAFKRAQPTSNLC